MYAAAQSVSSWMTQWSANLKGKYDISTGPSAQMEYSLCPKHVRSIFDNSSLGGVGKIWLSA
jgi:hypothetical protein